MTNRKRLTESSPLIEMNFDEALRLFTRADPMHVSDRLERLRRSRATKPPGVVPRRIVIRFAAVSRSSASVPQRTQFSRTEPGCKCERGGSNDRPS